MRMRLMFTKNGELIAEAEAEVVGKGDMAKGTCIVLEDVNQERSRAISDRCYLPKVQAR